jgi:pyruvate dehydrogenase E2 component (dihydrolipoamide acetyltransferase)
MPYEVVMPQLGMTMTEGSVIEWLKRPGEEVQRGEPLFIVQTDKVDMEVEATASGILDEVMLQAGAVVPVGTVIARITTASDTSPPPTVSSAPAVGKGRILASPKARALARELNIDIASVQAELGCDRVVEADIHEYVRHTRPAAVEQRPPSKSDAAEAAARTRIATRVTESVVTVPHFRLTAQAHATDLVRLRMQLQSDFERQAQVHLTFTDLLLRALAVAIKENPQSNASWIDGRVVARKTIDLSFAVQADARLLAPVVRNADGLSLPGLARTRQELVRRAREGRLTAADLEGGGCLLSNLGGMLVDQFDAIINPPQSFAVAVGRIAPRPFVINRELVVRDTVYLTLSADHRVLDGTPAARLLESLVRAIENPGRLLVKEAFQ